MSKNVINDEESKKRFIEEETVNSFVRFEVAYKTVRKCQMIEMTTMCYKQSVSLPTNILIRMNIFVIRFVKLSNSINKKFFFYVYFNMKELRFSIFFYCFSLFLIFSYFSYAQLLIIACK